MDPCPVMGRCACLPECWHLQTADDAREWTAITTASDSLRTLEGLLPSRPEAGLDVDWPMIEEAWDTEFPHDHKMIIARYGDALLGEYLEVLAPGVFTPGTCDEPGAPLGGMGFITADARDMWVDTRAASCCPRRPRLSSLTSRLWDCYQRGDRGCHRLNAGLLTATCPGLA